MDPIWQLLPEELFLNHIAPFLPIDTRLSLNVLPKKLVRCSQLDKLINSSLVSKNVNSLSKALNTHNYLIPLANGNYYIIYYDYGGIRGIYKGDDTTYIRISIVRKLEQISGISCVPGIVAHIVIPEDPRKLPSYYFATPQKKVKSIMQSH
jgi:hypothetical protein